jgi:hypothetical protein
MQPKANSGSARINEWKSTSLNSKFVFPESSGDSDSSEDSPVEVVKMRRAEDYSADAKERRILHVTSAVAKPPSRSSKLDAKDDFMREDTVSSLPGGERLFVSGVADDSSKHLGSAHIVKKRPLMLS